MAKHAALLRRPDRSQRSSGGKGTHTPRRQQNNSNMKGHDTKGSRHGNKKSSGGGDDDDDDDDDLPRDDVDLYMAERRKRQAAKLTGTVHDDGEDEDLHLADADMEEVLALEEEEDDEDDDEDEDEDEDEDGDVDKLGFEKKSVREVSLKAWGHSRKPFYGADVGDDELSSDEDVQEEESEVKRLQQERLSALQQEDFELADSFSKRVKQGTKSIAGGIEQMTPSEAVTAPMEQIEQDLTGLTHDELMSIVQQDSPELLQLLTDLRAKADEIRQQLLPQLELAREKQIDTNQGISLLDVKYRALHTIHNHCGGCSLQASGASVKDHPVVLQLVEQRALLEKLKPIESKLRYQINKLVAATNTGVSSTHAASNGVDALMFRPNVRQLMTQQASDVGEGSGGSKADGENRAYTVPKVAPMPYATEKEKALSKTEKLKRKAATSRILKDLREEFSDQPLEIQDDVLEAAEDPELAERERYEEENFIRLAETRKDKQTKRRRLEQQFRNEFEELDDFAGDDLWGGNDNNDVAVKRGRNPPSTASASRQPATVDEDDIEDEDIERYQSLKNAKAQGKQERQKQAKDYDEATLTAYDDSIDGSNNSKRGATYQIIKNAGLTVKRKKKEQRNPRVKRRVKYESALKKLKSAGARSVEREIKPYGGELTGIKTGTARSIPLK